MMTDYYEVQAFYPNNVRAFHAWHLGAFSRDMELRAALSRSDLGRVEWRMGRNGDWVKTNQAPAEAG